VPGLLTPEYPEGREPIYMSFVVHHERREALANALRSRGVDTTVGYMSDLSTSALFSEYQADCPNAERAARECLHIPVHPNLKSADVDHMIESVRAAVLEISH